MKSEFESLGRQPNNLAKVTNAYKMPSKVSGGPWEAATSSNRQRFISSHPTNLSTSTNFSEAASRRDGTPLPVFAGKHLSAMAGPPPVA